MENKYENGKIYKIINNEMAGLVYYGSTIQPLTRRMIEHKSRSKKFNCSSKSLFEYGTPEIILIENFPCNSKKELELEEGKYHLDNDCINRYVAGRTEEGYRINIKEKKKIYRENNREKLNERNKIYYKNNKEKLNKKNDCECGGKYTTSHKANHNKSSKHLEFISSN
tara:strand:- start:4756 stop:5259 length:504 start_codon:yes stop_codon:yes gene_type:complete